MLTNDPRGGIVRRDIEDEDAKQDQSEAQGRNEEPPPLDEISDGVIVDKDDEVAKQQRDEEDE